MRAVVLFTLLASALAAQPNRGLATLSAAVLPGTGQIIMGSRARGEAFLWLDGALWAVWGGLTWAAGSRDRDARLHAAREAGADLSITRDDYYRALERYSNAASYNEDIRREARDRYPDDPDAQRRYYQSRAYLGPEVWDWSSDSARFDYWDLRRGSRSASLQAGFAAGALLLNRLVSVVDVAFFSPGQSEQSRLELGSGSQLLSVELRLRF